MLAYIVTNTVTGRRYVGITTKTVKHRWARHIEGSRLTKGACTALGAAIRKHGKDAFIVEAIACATDADNLKGLERLLIAQEATLAPKGYNLTGGGDGLFHPSAKTRQRLSDAHKGRVASPETCARISLAKLGTRHTLEARASMSRERSIRFASPQGRAHMAAMSVAAQKSPKRRGWKQSDEFRARQAARMLGSKMPKGTGAKISAALRGVKKSDEHRANLSAAKKGKMSPAQEACLKAMSEAKRGKPGRKHSPETLLKMSAAQAARQERRRAEVPPAG